MLVSVFRHAFQKTRTGDPKPLKNMAAQVSVLWEIQLPQYSSNEPNPARNDEKESSAQLRVSVRRPYKLPEMFPQIQQARCIYDEATQVHDKRNEVRIRELWMSRTGLCVWCLLASAL